jgi:preprotein translocase subunit SecG
MFGGGAASSMGSSGVAERNLNRFTIAVGLLWAAAIILLGVLERFTSTF